jgi:hypothetical protein
MKHRGFYIFCDESIKRGKYFSDFYGGLIIEKQQFESVKNAIQSKVNELGLEDSELKWSNVNTFRLNDYKEIMDTFFAFVNSDVIKVRIMFTDNRFIALNLEQQHNNNRYHLLYYQFIKHAFGLRHFISDYPVDLEFFFDDIPDNAVANSKFKDFIYGLQYLPDLSEANLIIERINLRSGFCEAHSHAVFRCCIGGYGI